MIRKIKIKKGDTVTVITGKDRGKTGVVLKVLPKKQKLIIEGINVVHKHQRGRKSTEKGQILEKASPLHVSNVARTTEGGKQKRKARTKVA